MLGRTKNLLRRNIISKSCLLIFPGSFHQFQKKRDGRSGRERESRVSHTHLKTNRESLLCFRFFVDRESFLGRLLTSTVVRESTQSVTMTNSIRSSGLSLSILCLAQIGIIRLTLLTTWSVGKTGGVISLNPLSNSKI